MLRQSVLNKDDIITMDRADIDYEKHETLTQREVMYVTKMKKSLKYNIIEGCMHQNDKGLMWVRIQNATFSKWSSDILLYSIDFIGQQYIKINALKQHRFSVIASD